MTLTVKVGDKESFQHDAIQRLEPVHETIVN